MVRRAPTPVTGGTPAGRAGTNQARTDERGALAGAACDDGCRDTASDRTGAGILASVRRLILTPRWIVWHVLTLGAMVTCGFLSAWQWGRAGSAMGSALNVGYGLQWPLFAVFFGVMWWRMLKMEVARLDEPTTDDPPAPEPVMAAVPAPRPAAPSPFGPRPADAPVAPEDPDDHARAAYNRMLAQLAAADGARPGTKDIT